MACTNGPHSHKFCACCCLTQTYHCRQTALEALRAWPGGLHMGGGVSTSNAKDYLDAGASHVIVTSFVFRDGELDQDRLQQLVRWFRGCMDWGRAGGHVMGPALYSGMASWVKTGCSSW